MPATALGAPLARPDPPKLGQRSNPDTLPVKLTPQLRAWPKKAWSFSRASSYGARRSSRMAASGQWTASPIGQIDARLGIGLQHRAVQRGVKVLAAIVGVERCRRRPGNESDHTRHPEG